MVCHPHMLCAALICGGKERIGIKGLILEFIHKYHALTLPRYVLRDILAQKRTLLCLSSGTLCRPVLEVSACPHEQTACARTCGAFARFIMELREEQLVFGKGFIQQRHGQIKLSFERLNVGWLLGRLVTVHRVLLAHLEARLVCPSLLRTLVKIYTVFEHDTNHGAHFLASDPKRIAETLAPKLVLPAASGKRFPVHVLERLCSGSESLSFPVP